MKKKSFVCIALTAVMALSAAMLAACGDNDGENGDEPTAPVFSESTLPALFDSSGSTTAAAKGLVGTHDPVIVEAKNNGKSEYYVFATDNATSGFGVPVRKSTDLYTWEKVGVAVKGFTSETKETDLSSMYAGGNAELQEVYSVINSFKDWKNECWTLWAPDVVPAASNTERDVNGEWWMYSCWTAAFGSEQSVIFKLTSQHGIAGPYSYDGIIVQDSDQDNYFNEIDPSIYYSADGSQMFMSYGSFKGGFATLELDPATGMRKTGEVTEPGKRILYDSTKPLEFNAEGSVISYHTVNVYDGDIANEEYDASKWTTKSQYYMMGSFGALAYNYNMRVWTSDTPDGTFTSERGESGLQVSATWTWRKTGEGGSDGNTLAKDKELNFYIPGHNDMITTSDGVNLIAYHSRVAESMKDGYPSYAEGEHFLFTSMYDFNSKGQLVINPNRYVGEKIGTVTADDVLKDTEGLYSAIVIQSHDNGRYEEKAAIAHPVDLQLNADGTLTMGAETGAWKVYGDHYIWIKIGNLNYYGSVMPAQIRQYDSAFGYSYNNGFTISAISDVVNGENNILYMNMQF